MAGCSTERLPGGTTVNANAGLTVASASNINNPGTIIPLRAATINLPLPLAQQADSLFAASRKPHATGGHDHNQKMGIPVNMLTLPAGLRHLPSHLSPHRQSELVDVLREIVRQAPLYTPTMPGTGTPLSVRMTNCGALGWVSDQNRGYRYQDAHLVTGLPWPPIPELLLQLWRDQAGFRADPQACLINFYDADAKMGMHQDRDEEDLSAPVLSVSLGDACLFRVGGTARRDKTVSIRLESGDLVVLGGSARMAFHGVSRIYSGTSGLLASGGRINLTLRRVTASS
jgi:alkylated DNA repair protein (DNA oxidative demethylase)